MRADVLLCDYAEAVNGKLYISGGGWAIAQTVAPIRCSLAIRLAVSWAEANQPHDLKVSLLTQDGQTVTNGPGDAPVEAGGKFEVGRPPGMIQGEDLVNCLVLNYEGLDLDTGQYVFSVSIDNEIIATVPFRIVKIQTGVPSQ